MPPDDYDMGFIVVLLAAIVLCAVIILLPYVLRIF